MKPGQGEQGIPESSAFCKNIGLLHTLCRIEQCWRKVPDSVVSSLSMTPVIPSLTDDFLACGDPISLAPSLELFPPIT